MSAAALFDALVLGRDSGGARAAGPVGYWSPPTAPINWCEQDYEMPVFVAEFWNTISNAAYVVVGLAALGASRGDRSVGYTCAAACCCLTGLFSGLFHATLHLHFQRLDEVFETGILIFMYHDNAPRSAWLHFAVASGGIWLSTTSMRFCELHLVAMIFATIHRFGQVSTNVPAAKTTVHWAAASTAMGFASWLLDRTCCDVVSKPFLPINLHLHAWWHLWTALALHFGFATLQLLHKAKRS